MNTEHTTPTDDVLVDQRATLDAATAHLLPHPDQLTPWSRTYLYEVWHNYGCSGYSNSTWVRANAPLTVAQVTAALRDMERTELSLRSSLPYKHPSPAPVDLDSWEATMGEYFEAKRERDAEVTCIEQVRAAEFERVMADGWARHRCAPVDLTSGLPGCVDDYDDGPSLGSAFTVVLEHGCRCSYSHRASRAGTPADDTAPPPVWVATTGELTVFSCADTPPRDGALPEVFTSARQLINARIEDELVRYTQRCWASSVTEEALSGFDVATYKRYRAACPAGGYQSAPPVNTQNVVGELSVELYQHLADHGVYLSR